MARLLKEVSWVAIGFVPVLVGLFLLNPSAGNLEMEGDFTPPASDRSPSKDQIALVFIGSSTCGASRSQRIRDDLKRAIKLLTVQVEAAELDLHTIGVAVASTTSRGLELLSFFQEFDEILVGGSLFSIGVR